MINYSAHISRLSREQLLFSSAVSWYIAFGFNGARGVERRMPMKWRQVLGKRFEPGVIFNCLDACQRIEKIRKVSLKTV